MQYWWPVSSGRTTLHEMETHWSINDWSDCIESLEIEEDTKEYYSNKKGP